MPTPSLVRKQVGWAALDAILAGPGALALILVAAFAIRIWGLTEEGPTLDELHSMWASDSSHTWGELYHALVVSETHLPAYFLLLRGWMWAGGMGEQWVRLLSVIIGVAGVWAMARLGTRLHDRRFGLLLAALTAVFYYHVEQSQTVRFYGMVFCLQALSLYYFVGLLRGDSRRSTWLGWWVSAALGLCTFYYSVFGVVAQSVVLLIELVRQRRLFSREVLTRWSPALVGLGGVTLFFLLLSPQSLGEVTRSRTIVYQFDVGIEWYWNCFTAWFGPADAVVNRRAPLYGEIAMSLWLASTLVVSARSLTGSFSSPSNAGTSTDCSLVVRLGMVIICVFILLCTLHSLIAGQIVFARYFIVILPAALLLLAEALWSLPGLRLRRWVVAIVLSLFAVNTLVVPGLQTGAKENWRLAATHLSMRTDRYPVLTHMHEQYNTMAKSLGLKTNAEPLSGPLADSVLRKGEGFWLVRLGFYPFSTPLLDSALAHRFTEVVRYDDLNRLELAQYQAGTAAPMGIRKGDAHLAEPLVLDPSLGSAPFQGWLDVLDSIAPTQRTFFGWARIKDYSPPGEVLTELLLMRDSMTYRVPTFRLRRRDIRHDEWSGFEGRLQLDGLPVGKYRVGILVSDLYRKRQAYSGPLGNYTIVVPEPPKPQRP